MSEQKKVYKVLVVDDEPDLREVCVEFLKNMNVDAHQAENGKQGLEVIKKINPDVVITDINMPVMSGLELMSSAREHGFMTPFIVVTGFGDRDTMRKAWHLGATDFLDKPINPRHLMEVVKAALEIGAQPNLQRTQSVLTQNFYKTFPIYLEHERFKKLQEVAESKNVSIATFVSQLIFDALNKK